MRKHRFIIRFITVFMALSMVLPGCFATAATNEEKNVNTDKIQTMDSPDNTRGVMSIDTRLKGVEELLKNSTVSKKRSAKILKSSGQPLPEKYDGRKEHRLSSVKNQSYTGMCWAFSLLESAQDSYLTEHPEVDEFDLSEWQLAYFMYKQTVDPLSLIKDDFTSRIPDREANKYYYDGGSYLCATFAIARGIGLCYESDGRFEVLNSILENNGNGELDDNSAFSSNDFRLDSTKIINPQQKDLLKKAIMENGAGCFGYYHDSNYYDVYFNSYNCPDNGAPNHAVSIVGWDDNFPKENFKYEPENNGAWLIKNSWSDAWGDDGYFWLSYEDSTINLQPAVFLNIDDEMYDHTYQYDGGTSISQTNNSYSKISNVFTAFQKETLQAVSFYTTDSDTDYEVSVYKNLTDKNNPESGEKVASKTGRSDFAGYKTIKLSEEQYVSLEKGDTFSVVVKESKNGKNTQFFIDQSEPDSWVNFVNKANSQESYAFNSSKNKWEDFSKDGKTNFRIKAFTNVVQTVNPSSVSFEEETYNVNENESVFVKVLGDGEVINEKCKLEFTIDDSNIASADSLGNIYAKKRGSTKVTVVCGDKKSTCILNVTGEPVTSISKDYATKENPLKIKADEKVKLVYETDPVNATADLTWKAVFPEGVPENSNNGVSKNGEFSSGYPGDYKVTASGKTSDGTKVCLEYYIKVENDVVDCTGNKELLESEHPYDSWANRLYSYKGEEEKMYAMKFDNDCSFEDQFDYLYVFDGKENEDDIFNGKAKAKAKYTGTELQGKTIYFYEDVYLLLKTDAGIEDYGFKVTDISEFSLSAECTFGKTDYVIAAGETETITSTITPDDSCGIVRYEIENPVYATIDENGVITGKKIGKTKVIAYNFIDEVIGEANLEITGESPDQIAFSQSSIEMLRNNVFKTEIVQDVSKEDILYTSSNEGVASVDKTGVVTANGVGEAVITAETKGGTSGVKTSMTVTVTAPSNPSLDDMQSTHNYQFNMDETYEYHTDENDNCMILVFDNKTLLNDGSYIEVLDENDEIVNNKKYTNKELSNAKVTVYGNVAKIHLVTNQSDDSDKTKYGFKVRKIISGKRATGIRMDSLTLNLASGLKNMGKLKYQLEPADAIDRPEFSIDNTNIVDIYYTDFYGTIYAINIGQTTVTAVLPSGLKAKANVTVINGEEKEDNPIIPETTAPEEKPVPSADIVKVNNILVYGSSHTIAPGKKLKLLTTVLPNNATDKNVTFTSSNTKYAKVNSKGVVTALKKGAGKSVTIYVTAKDGSKIKEAYKIKISKKAIKKIKVKAANKIKAGKKIKIKVTTTPSKGCYKTMSYKSLTPEYATVSKKGVIRIKKTASEKTVKIQVMTKDGTRIKKILKIKVI